MTKPSFFDLLQPGMKRELGCHTFGKEEIIEFAKKFDPQRFHLSEEGGKDSLFGRLCASGWHTGSVWMRLNVQAGMKPLLEQTGYEGPPPILGPSPGVRNLKWHHPVYVGDTISYSSEITTKRKNPRREGWGLVIIHSEGHNQTGDLVISMYGAVTLRID